MDKFDKMISEMSPDELIGQLICYCVPSKDDDETKENIDLGLISEEDAIKALGGNMAGNSISEYRIKSLSRTSAKGSEPTVYSEEDLKKLPIKVETEEVIEDIFSDDEDDDI